MSNTIDAPRARPRLVKDGSREDRRAYHQPAQKCDPDVMLPDPELDQFLDEKGW